MERSDLLPDWNGPQSLAPVLDAEKFDQVSPFEPGHQTAPLKVIHARYSFIYEYGSNGLPFLYVPEHQARRVCDHNQAFRYTGDAVDVLVADFIAVIWLNHLVINFRVRYVQIKEIPQSRHNKHVAIVL